NPRDDFSMTKKSSGVISRHQIRSTFTLLPSPGTTPGSLHCVSETPFIVPHDATCVTNLRTHHTCPGPVRCRCELVHAVALRPTHGRARGPAPRRVDVAGRRAR